VIMTFQNQDGEETELRAFLGAFTKRHGHGHVTPRSRSRHATVTFSVKNERFTVDITRKIKNAEENAIKRSCNFMNVKISV
jgi:hypothetical protein